MKQIEKIIGVAMLVFAIGFNLWIYRLEPTAKIDPNDNTFQFALIDRTNQIWEFAQKNCSKNFTFFICHFSLLSDHWVPNWAEGYNLPYYYSHIPQIIIVASWRLLSLFTFHFSLFTYYHVIIYLLLSFFPLSVFLSLRLISSSWLTAGFGAIIATQLSTDGLYGLDPASFLWRGYGLSSQLFAMIWLPFAVAYSYRGKVIPAIILLAATTAGHLGIGIIAFFSVAVIGWRNPKKLLMIYGGTIVLLAYWILPILIHGNYHNISVWDPVWKFDSYGARETIIRLFNGDLFDFGRLPILTGLVFVGMFASPRFALLFIFWLLMYFGRTTWGPLIDLIPGMREFHLSRFIVGLHIAGLFLIPMVLESFRITVIKLIIVIIVIFSVFPQTIRYASYNDVLIKQANENYAVQSPDANALIDTLKNLPPGPPASASGAAGGGQGRVFAGRGGSWGRDFRIAETPYYMYLSTYGIPTVLWLPETWSPNSDTEQYFSEDQLKDYALYNIRYVVAPPSQETQPFWQKIKETGSWVLYSLDLSSLSDVGDLGYITTGIRPAIVSTSKETFINVVRLWIQSDDPKNGLYPELTFDKSYPKSTGLPNFRMLDEVTYQTPDKKTHNLFSEIPVYLSDVSNLSTVSDVSSDSDMLFRASVEIPEGCTECLVILKQTFHPSWRVTIDGKPSQTLTVFPFYVAVSVPEGSHDVVFSYQPSGLKVFLLVLSLITLIFLR